jgi:hypothetical protein
MAGSGYTHLALAAATATRGARVTGYLAVAVKATATGRRVREGGGAGQN